MFKVAVNQINKSMVGRFFSNQKAPFSRVFFFLFFFIGYLLPASYAQPNWSPITTLNSHVVLLENVSIQGLAAQNGDYIGVFYDSLGVPACAGMVLWEGVTTAVVVWGDDDLTLEKDGFADQEFFQWRIWRAADSAEFIAEPTYMTSLNDSAFFVVNGMSGLSLLNGTDPYFSPFLVSGESNSPLCFDDCNGSITLNIQGGQPPYQVNWSNGHTGNSLIDACAGTYEITVSDQTANLPEYDLPWAYQLTTDMHNIVVSQPIVTVNGQSPSPGDYVGVFYESGTDLVCGGYSLWTGGNIVVSAWGNDPTTSDKNGFYPAEAFQWKIWRSADNQEVSMIAQYSPFFTHLGTFAPGGFSSLTGLTGTYTPPPAPEVNDTVLVFTLLAPDALVLHDSISDYSGFPISVFGAQDGFILTEVSGGTEPYSYVWSNGSTEAEQVSLSAGTYSLTVQDANACSLEATWELSEPAQVFDYQVVADIVPVACSGDCTGNISIEVLGGVAPYSYSWSTGSTDSELDSLCAGSYSLTVVDSSEPALLSSFDWTYSAGSITHTILVSPGNLTVNGQPVSIGDYLGVFYNDNGTWQCGGYTMFNGIQTGLTAYGDDPQTSGVKEGFAAGESFEWRIWKAEDSVLVDTVIPVYNTTFIHNAQFVEGGVSGILSLAGIHQAETPENTLIYTFEVPENSPIELIPSLSDYNGFGVSFFGEDDGFIELSAQGGVSPYTFQWSTGATSSAIDGLEAGSYFVTVTDALSCTRVDTFELTEPAQQLFLSTNAVVTNESCPGTCDGSIQPNPQGGFPPYFYSWSNGSSSASLEGLCPGNYSLTISDSNFGNPSPVPLPWTYTNTSINHTFLLQSGTIQITGLPIETGDYIGAFYEFGGQLYCGGYVQWAGTNTTLVAKGNNSTSGKNGFFVGETIQWKVWKSGQYVEIDMTASYSPAFPAMGSFMSGGTSVVTALSGEYELVSGTDPLIVSFDVQSTPALQVDSALVQEVSCFGGSDGSIELIVLGGTPPYEASWSNGSTGLMLLNLESGNYHYTLTDANDCSQEGSIQMAEPTLLELMETQYAGISCFQSNDGSVSLTPQGGTAPYLLSWSDGSTSFEREGLAPGIYAYTLSDANACTMEGEYLFEEPDSLVIQQVGGEEPSCFSYSNGSLEIEVLGGTQPYDLVWSNGATDLALNLISAGNYTASVSDANNCQSVLNLVLAEPEELTASTLIDSISCWGATDGSIQVQIDGGTPIFGITWSGGAVGFTPQNLPSGNYSFTVSDLNACSYSATVALSEPEPIQLLSSTVASPSCFGLADGMIQPEIAGGTAPYSYSWSNGETASLVEGLTAGTYILTVIDSRNCSASFEFVLEDPAVLNYSMLSVQGVSCPGGNDGSLSLSGLGGNPPYTLTWSDNATGFMRESLTAGTYFFTLSDVNDCSLSDSVVVEEPESFQATLLQESSPTCFGNSDGSLTVVVSGGTGPYSYEWSNGATQLMLDQLAAGSYHLSVTDANGCAFDSSFSLAEPDPIVVVPTVLDAGCAGCSDGSIQLGVSGGTAPYAYTWSNGASTASINGLAPGNYLFTVTDANSCAYLSTVVVGPIVVSPGWDFINTGNNHTILIQASTPITIDNVPIEPGDFIGVFYDSLGTPVCAGYQQYTGQVGAVAAFGEDDGLDGFAPNEKFQWYIWKAATQETFPATATYMTSMPNQGNYVINGMSGLASLTVETTGAQTIELVYNWNLFSTYLEPFNPSFDTVVNSIVDKIILAKDFAGNPFWPSFNLNQIGDFTPGEAYQIRVTEACSFDVSGSIIFPEFHPISLPINWSMVAYLRNNPAPISEVVSAVESNLILVKNTFGFIYWPAFGVNDIGYMLPGQGFAFKMNGPASFTYPPNAVEYAAANFQNSFSSRHFDLATRGEYDQTLAIPTDAWPVLPDWGDEVAAFNGRGELCGSGTYRGGNMAFTLWGAPSGEDNVFLPGEEMKLIWYRQSAQDEVEMEIIEWSEGNGVFKNGQISVVSSFKVSDVGNQLLSLQNQPNPFRNETRISFGLPETGPVTLSLYDMDGKLIRELVNQTLIKGQHEVEVWTDGLPAGTYFCRLQSHNQVLIQKMIRMP